MGWFASGIGAARRHNKEPSLALLHRLQCRICPLDKLKENRHPHIPAQGAERPLIYVLGEAPGRDEDRDNQQFIGASGQVLREELPEYLLPQIRWNNVVRTRPKDNEDPTPIEIECCRPSVAGDIAASKPKAILGFGNIALKWATQHSGIMTWRGRRTPVNIDGHVCWYYPMQHPASILHEPHEAKKDSLHRVFRSDLAKAIAEIDSLPEPEVHDREVAGYGVEFAYGNKEGDLQRVESQLRWAMKQEEVGLDLETKGYRPYAEGSKILTLAIGSRDNSFSVALGHKQAKWSRSDLKHLRDLIREFLHSKVRKIVHFLRFEMEWLADRYGWDVVYAGRWGGTETQAAVIDERSGAMSLDFLVQQYFGFDLKALSPLNKLQLDNEPIEDVLSYNAMDAKYHYLLWQMQNEIIKQRKFEHLYDEMIARVPSCVLTQLRGIPVNPQIAATLATKYEQQIEAARADVMAAPQLKQFRRHYAKEGIKEFKPLSDDHCVKLFRHVLGYNEGLSKLPGRDHKFAVDEEVLKQIGLPICFDILRLRKASKRLSTYIYRNNEKKTIVWPDGLLHPNFNTVKVRTKRLSADEPNCQNIPKRDEDGKEVRAQIEAPEGLLLCSADHGQIQARGIAMSSQDKQFCQALWERFDVHGYWAERIAKAYPRRVDNVTNFKDEAGKKVLKKFRADIKNQWTFPLFFGARMERVAEELHIPVNVIEPEFNAFEKMFAGVFQWHEELIRFYNRNGYVEDLFGFRHHAPLSKNEIINSPIQSLEALFVMRGMNQLSRHAAQTGDWHYQPIAQIHDDLTFLLPESNIDVYVQKIVTEMLNVTFPWVNIPMTLEVAIGPNLLDMKECLVASSDDWK
jgi:uracil-DNA glycosylase family 4